MHKTNGISQGSRTIRTTTGISLPAELKQAAERQARREHRSLSSLISFALARYLREMGVWEEDEPVEGGPDGGPPG
jgi:CopG antitoxin of type II toxin-antitoxin system